MKITCISDTHESHRSLKLEGGDLLIHAGDITFNGNLDKLQDFCHWLKMQQYRCIVVIAGNHDGCFEDYRRDQAIKMINDTGAVYLENCFHIFDGVKIYGSPNTLNFCNWYFNNTQEELKKIWAKIPYDTDILVTHGPPYKIHDECPDGHRAGCPELLQKIGETPNIKLHVFGHIHEGGGKLDIIKKGTTFVNAAVLDGKYKLKYKPKMIDMTFEEKE